MIGFLFFLIIVLLGVYSYRKTITKKRTPVPNNLHELLMSHVLFYQKLKDEDKLLFRDKITIFLSKTYIETIEFKRQDIDIVLVAASAIIPVFYFKDWHYSNLSSVIIYPNNFSEDLNFIEGNRNIGGLVGTGRFKNQMILSRRALHHGFANKTDKGNTGIHEFIHLIDKMDGDTDGIPKLLLSNTYLIPWLNLIHKEIEHINNNESDIRAYGGTNQQEFFAVVSEYFFERPDLLKEKHPDLYKMMEMCFCKQN